MDQRPAPPASTERIALPGGFMLDVAGHALRDAAGHSVELRPQAFEVLRLLAERRGQLVLKEELFAQVWPGLVVTDDSLVQAIGDVRRALGEAGRTAVRTVPRRGYLLEADGEEDVLALNGSPEPPAAETRAPRPRRSRRWALLAALGGLLLVTLGITAWWAGSAQPALGLPQPSIAVLPFSAPTPEGEALARDLAADLVSELARSPELRVIASQSSFALADERLAVPEIGRRLRSRYLVGGTVRREGETLTMAIDLLDSEDGRIVWSSRSEVGRESLAAARRELVARICGSLQVRVAGNEERRALERAPGSLEVVALMAQGHVLQRRYSPEGIRAARRLFEQAIELDPNYAPAWAALGQINNIDIGSRVTGEWDRRRMPEVIAQLQQALALQPDLPTAHVALSEAYGVAGAYEASLASADRCLRLSPNSAGCLYAMGAAQLRVGQVDAALQNLERARDRNPLAPAFLAAFYGTALWAARQHEAAIRIADECLALAPDFHRCRVNRISALVELGRDAEARDEANRLIVRLPKLTSEEFAGGFAQGAAELRNRRLDAAKKVGIPSAPGVSR